MTFAERTKKSLELRSADRLDCLTNESVCLRGYKRNRLLMAPSGDRLPRTNRDRSPTARRRVGKLSLSLYLLHSPAISARSVRLTRRDCCPIVDLLCGLLVGARPPLVGASARTGRGDYPIAFAVGKHRCAEHLAMTDGGARLGQSGAPRGGVGSTLIAAAN